MKKLVLLLLVCFLLVGCGASSPETQAPSETRMPTEPARPWIETVGMPWDEEGALVELAIALPDSLPYGSGMAFDGDLLLWSVDDHRRDQTILELCLIELDTGTITREIEMSFQQHVYPQVLGDSLFLCDNENGLILELNKELQVVNSWNVGCRDANFRMGTNDQLYIYTWSGSLSRMDLATGEETILLPGDPYVEYFTTYDDSVFVEYADSNTGAMEAVVLDLIDNRVLEIPVKYEFAGVEFMGGTWLMEIYEDGATMILGQEESGFRMADLGYSTVELIAPDRLLHTWDDGQQIGVFDLDGTCLGGAQLTYTPYSHSCIAAIPSEIYGGYFLLLTDYEGSLRLLYWDLNTVNGAENMFLQPLPAPGEEEEALRHRVEELENRFGLEILAGQEADEYFFDFNATRVTDWLALNKALTVLEEALSQYPEGFLRQLRYEDMRNLQIHLVQDIVSTNEEYVDVYEAFVQYNYDGHAVVMDINMATVDTYYHEISHVINSYLEWDAWKRDEALFSEAGWDSLNPDWFPGYTYDYSWRQYVQDYSWFIDDYSTIMPSEDRARVMEYAMSEYGYYAFEGAEGLLAKLDYYARCIRDAFDTTGWPQTVLWEQYLK